MKGMKLGFAVCGSFCTLERTLQEMRVLAEHEWEIQPILSPITYETDTRFGKAEDWRRKIEETCGREIWHTIPQVEPIGPKGLLDILLIAPCTGNTLGKMANGITDTSVTMAAKAHLRNQRPVVVAVSTNDGLSASARNIGTLMNTRQVFLVPFGQDDFMKKETSLVADFGKIEQSLASALTGHQLQPLFLQK